MKYKINHIPISDKRPSIKMNPKYITIHSTANPKSTAKNERDWLTNPSNKRTASWHIVVGDEVAIEAIPFNEVAWHAGDGGNGTGNRQSIGIEMCESGNREEVIKNTIQVTVDLMKKYNIGINNLKRHYDWTKKNCPRILNYNNWQGWDKFKNEVQKRLEGDNMKKKEQAVSEWAKESWKWAKKNNITDGKRPCDSMTREEMVTMLYRYDKTRK